MPTLARAYENDLYFIYYSADEGEFFTHNFFLFGSTHVGISITVKNEMFIHSFTVQYFSCPNVFFALLLTTLVCKS